MIIPPFNSPKNFPEDEEQYTNRCFSCGEYFWGYKRRYACKECSSEPELLITEGVKCGIAVAEVWEKTLDFRWYGWKGEGIGEATLQQRHKSNLGNEKWENVERIIGNVW